MATNQFKKHTGKNIGATLTAVGPIVGANTQTTVIGFTIANTSDVTISIDVGVKDAGGITTYVIKNAPLIVGSSLVVVGGDQKLVLETGDQIFVKSTQVDSADVIISLLNIIS